MPDKIKPRTEHEMVKAEPTIILQKKYFQETKPTSRHGNNFRILSFQSFKTRGYPVETSSTSCHRSKFQAYYYEKHQPSFVGVATTGESSWN